jgi:cytochrome c5
MKPALSPSSSGISGVAPLFAGIACALVALACASKMLPQPSEGQAAYATKSGKPSTVNSLDQGRDLYILKCDKCHSLPTVQDHSPEKWDKIMNKMKGEADLSAREDYLIRTYVVTSSAWVRDSLRIR